MVARLREAQLLLDRPQLSSPPLELRLELRLGEAPDGRELRGLVRGRPLGGGAGGHAALAGDRAAAEAAAKEAKAEAERDAADAANLERQKAMEADGKQVKGGLHKFDASEVDAYGGEGTADDLMDAFGF